MKTFRSAVLIALIVAVGAARAEDRPAAGSLVHFGRVVVPPVARTDVANLVAAGTLDTDGYKVVVLNLAGELKSANGNHEVAFARYQERLRAFIATKQKAALKFASFFAPRSRFGIVLGNKIMKLMTIPFISELAAGREIRDSIDLPDY